MRILSNDHSFSHFLADRNSPRFRASKRHAKTQEFQQQLEQAMNDQTEEGEEFRILLPKHGKFWDNGYEDLE